MTKSLIVIVLAAALLATVWFVGQGIILPKELGSVEKADFFVQRGQGTKEIAAYLAEEGFIVSDLLFRAYAVVGGVSRQLKAGKYLLSPGMTIPEIVEAMVAGNVIRNTVTIIEGWNIRDIGRYLEGQGIMKAEELFLVVGFPQRDYREIADLQQPHDFSGIFTFLQDKPAYLGLEGYLFPDTYEMSSEDKVEDIVKKMLVQFDEKLSKDLRKDIAAQGKTIFEIVIMASLLEKEVRTFRDKKIVSGVLWKRLKINMPLQVDATIIYIASKKTTNITRADKNIDSSYNTYKYRGLPIGPITNPGRESMVAAIYPEANSYWYYLSTPAGKTIFSPTLQAHNIAKATYLR